MIEQKEKQIQQLGELYNRNDNSLLAPELFDQFVYLIKLRASIETVKRDGILEQYQPLATGFANYQISADLVSRMLFSKYTELLETKDQEILVKSNKYLANLRTTLSRIND